MANVKQTTKRMLSEEIDVDKYFKFCPYSDSPHGVSPLDFFKEEKKEVKLKPKKIHFHLSACS